MYSSSHLIIYSPDNSAFSFKKSPSIPYDRKENYDLNQNADAMFPVLVPDRVMKMKAQFKRRASSPEHNDMIDSPVQETVEENEVKALDNFNLTFSRKTKKFLKDYAFCQMKKSSMLRRPISLSSEAEGKFMVEI
jgi:hypothetical protein